MTTFPTRERVLEVIETHAPDVLKAVLRDNLAPAIALILQKTDDENIAIGQSEIGGAPDVPPDFEWPTVEVSCWKFFKRVREEKSLGFLAQFDLAEVAPFDLNGELPSSGMLSFYYLIDGQPYRSNEENSPFRVYYWADDVNLNRNVNTQIEERNALPSCCVSFANQWQCPSCDSPKLIDTDISYFDDLFESPTYEMFYDVAPDIPRHQMLGYAESVQDDVLVSLAFDLPHEARRKDENRHQYSERIVREEASKWRLLFQLDSQSSLEKRKWDWIWGDAGKIYFCIRDEDLKAKSFDKVAFEMQFT